MKRRFGQRWSPRTSRHKGARNMESNESSQAAAHEVCAAFRRQCFSYLGPFHNGRYEKLSITAIMRRPQLCKVAGSGRWLRLESAAFQLERTSHNSDCRQDATIRVARWGICWRRNAFPGIHLWWPTLQRSAPPPQSYQGLAFSTMSRRQAYGQCQMQLGCESQALARPPGRCRRRTSHNWGLLIMAVMKSLA